MQSSLHSKKPTTAQVAAVSFGFFNDEEVRCCWGAEEGAGL